MWRRPLAARHALVAAPRAREGASRAEARARRMQGSHQVGSSVISLGEMCPSGEGYQGSATRMVEVGALGIDRGAGLWQSLITPDRASRRSLGWHIATAGAAR